MTSETLSPSNFEPYIHDVYGWAYRLLGRHHDALDVVQDVFIRWDRQCGQSPPSSPRGWLRRVTLNRAIDFKRRGTVAAHGSTTLDEQPATNPATGDGMDRATLRDDVAAAMTRLSDAQRSVLVAKIYDGMTFAQIATELDVTVSTVKTHYLRAVQAVRDRLHPRWSPEKQR